MTTPAAIPDNSAIEALRRHPHRYGLVYGEVDALIRMPLKREAPWHVISAGLEASIAMTHRIGWQGWHFEMQFDPQARDLSEADVQFIARLSRAFGTERERRASAAFVPRMALLDWDERSAMFALIRKARRE